MVPKKQRKQERRGWIGAGSVSSEIYPRACLPTVLSLLSLLPGTSKAPVSRSKCNSHFIVIFPFKPSYPVRLPLCPVLGTSFMDACIPRRFLLLGPRPFPDLQDQWLRTRPAKAPSFYPRPSPFALSHRIVTGKRKQRNKKKGPSQRNNLPSPLRQPSRTLAGGTCDAGDHPRWCCRLSQRRQCR